MFNFSDIVGNNEIIKNLKNSILHGHVSHAYLFEGEEGIGKSLLAQCFAKTLLCERGQEIPCGKCSSCLTFDSSNNPDVIRVERTKAKSIGVDDIREQVNSEIAVRPYKYRYKIFIIDNAEAMTPAAQNALLKTLEEPRSYGVFLLIATSVSLLLPTVLSRCVLFKLKPLPFDQVKSYLLNHIGELDDAKAHLISVYANGNIGRAVEAARDENFAVMRSRIIHILDRIFDKDFIELFLLAKELEAVKDQFGSVLNIALMWYRDIAVVKELSDTSKIFQRDIEELLLENSKRMKISSVYKNIEVILDIKDKLRYNANFQLSTEVLLMKLCENQ